MIKTGVKWGLLVVAIATISYVSAREENVNPGINQLYKKPVFKDWVARFERPGREVYDKRYEIIDATGVKDGMAVADIGAGTGLFTRLFSKKVGKTGRVYAVDISSVFIENIMRINRERGHTNVVGIINRQDDIPLPLASIDLAFICDTYHHFEYPGDTLRALHRALRPGGELIVVDFRKDRKVVSDWVMHHVRASKGIVIGEIEAAGFKLEEEKNFLRANYFLRFKRI